MLGGVVMAYEKVKYNQEYNKDHYYKPGVYMPLEYKDKLKKAAEEYTDGSVSKFIIQAIDEFFENHR